VELQGKTAFITGGAGGIGTALSSALRAAGATVVTADLAGADVDLDVTDAGAVAEAITGLDRLDVVVANAGIGVGGLVEDIARADWDRSIDVNIRGVVNTVLPAYARLREQGSGQIVLVASLAGLAGTPLLTPYAMTKAALVNLGASLRPEAARHGIGVTTVCPGPVETPLLDEDSPTPGTSVRRYLVASAGKPITPEALADQVLDAVRKDRALVIPGRAKLLWRLSRFAPNLTNGQIAKGMQKELDAAG
jgi:NAD(P)-dependent dehydrogenase (short-subunit alcohol dehydrogenase family)